MVLRRFASGFKTSTSFSDFLLFERTAQLPVGPMNRKGVGSCVRKKLSRSSYVAVSGMECVGEPYDARPAFKRWVRMSLTPTSKPSSPNYEPVSRHAPKLIELQQTADLCTFNWNHKDLTEGKHGDLRRLLDLIILSVKYLLTFVPFPFPLAAVDLRATDGLGSGIKASSSDGVRSRRF